MRIAFYAPLKPLDHPSPSGDRRMGRLIVTALRHAGHTVDIASELRSYEGVGDPAVQRTIRDRACSEVRAILARYRHDDPARRPGAWVTYHLYYKAPDWIGPTVAETLGIGYLVVEASHASKRRDGPWRSGHCAVGEALARADAILSVAARDEAGVRAAAGKRTLLRRLPPFVESVAIAAPVRREALRTALGARFGLDPRRHWLLAVAMMRPGDKLNSYRQLAVATARLAGDDWQLLVVGDGSARADVEAAFAAAGRRGIDAVRFAGSLDRKALDTAYLACDLMVWPAVNEAYGMALLEAAAAGLPAIVGDHGGVREVVAEARSGVVVPPDDPESLAVAVRSLLDDPARRGALSAGARRYVAEGHTIETAADVLDAALSCVATRRMERRT
jgi:glycosyltransferase involved in cell wall biosynthesis